VNEKILFVDDEPAVLDGYKRVLYKEFSLDTATSGEVALARISSGADYAVVVSDMRMPGMDGVQLLSAVGQKLPNTVRVVLTGHADLQSAIDAVNEGRIFRFLTKPCEADSLKKALTTCLVQYRLILAEKELLENTLMGSIKVLADVLSLANPAAFGRAMRIRRYVQHLVTELKLQAPWKYEMAAMLSQLGCVTLPPEVIEAAYQGEELSPEQQLAFATHPTVARNLLSNIPRLDGIAWIIGNQAAAEAELKKEPSDSLRIGADILRTAIAFDNLKIQGKTDGEALAILHFDKSLRQNLVESLATLPVDPGATELRTVRIAELATGMILQEEIRTGVGMLLVGRGQEVTYPLIVRLKNFSHRKAIPDKVLVLCPSLGTKQSEKSAAASS
jgi:CheY-like chemotaxis protein